MATVVDWASTFLIEDRRWLDICEDKTPEGKAECARAVGMQNWAMEHLLKDRARTPAELSAKIAVAINWLTCDGFEHSLAILHAVMTDLRTMELMEDDEEEVAPADAAGSEGEAQA